MGRRVEIPRAGTLGGFLLILIQAEN